MRTENVLIVADDDVLRSDLALFSSKEFQRAVATGTEATKQIGDMFYHIVILDQQLTDIDGAGKDRRKA